MVWLIPGESNMISVRDIHGLKVIHTKKARLDFLVSSELMTLTDKVKISPGYRSDQAMIELHITFTKFERGKKIWSVSIWTIYVD